MQNKNNALHRNMKSIKKSDILYLSEECPLIYERHLQKLSF